MDEETAFLVTRELAGVLSVAVVRVAYRTGCRSDMIDTCASMAACSRSLLVTSPVGLSCDTRRAWIDLEKGWRHR